MKKVIFITLCTVSFCEAADQPRAGRVPRGIRWDMLVRQYYEEHPEDKDKKFLNLGNKQITAIPDDLSLPNLDVLILENNQITAIPDDLSLPNLSALNLKSNQITAIDPEQILNQFPNLGYLNLKDNPLTHENVKQLAEAAQKAGRYISLFY